MNLGQKKQYINILASSTGVDLSNFDTDPLLKAGVKDKHKLNQLFFDLIKSKSKDKKDKIKKSNIEIALSQAKINKIEKSFDSKIATRLKKVGKLVKMISDAQSEIVALEKEKNRILSKKEINIGEKFDNVVKAGFWKIAGKNKDIILLETVNDIICKDIDNDALQKNLGKFVARLDVNKMELTLHKEENQSKNDLLKEKYFSSNEYDQYIEDYYRIHPYVSDDNYICWGNAESTVTKLKKEYNIEKLFQLLVSLLTTHASGGFTHLSEF